MNFKTFGSLAFIFSFFLFSNTVSGQQETDFSIEDFKFLNGLYSGTLTYKDYSSDKIVPLQLVCNTYFKGDQVIQKILINENFENYSQEYKYKIKDGSIDGFEVISNQIGKTNLKIIATQKGKDGNQNRPCTFKYTFDASEQEYTITKEVKFDDEQDYFIRNQYHFKRIEKLNPEKIGFK